MAESIKKIYIEPTNHCNLFCATCIRNTFTHEYQELSMAVFEQMTQDMKKMPALKTVVFSGFGEPLCHKNILEMIAEVKAIGVSPELITNGMLLTEKMSSDLMDAGLDMIWVSIDGGSADNYEKIREGAVHNELIKNLIGLSTQLLQKKSKMKLGISFVAMKGNIHELEDVVNLAQRLGASEMKVTNVIPYTEEMVKASLYDKVMSLGKTSKERQLTLDLPPMDLDDATLKTVDRLSKAMHTNVTMMGNETRRKEDYCKFVQENMMVIGADGRVAPCLSLLYDNTSYLNNYERKIEAKSYGNINENSLLDIWTGKSYAGFRNKVTDFDFSYCTSCGGCDNLESNKEDCFGNEFPVCGGCLWAQGIIQCP